MSKITLVLKNHSYLRVLDCEHHVVEELSTYFQFDVPNAKFIPAVKKGHWDGKIRLFNRNTGELNAGLFLSLKRFAIERGYELDIKEGVCGLPNTTDGIDDELLGRFIEALKLPFKPYDYQYDAIKYGIVNKRAVLLSPTGSGKSLIIYVLMRAYLARNTGNVLIVVPTTGLVEQMMKDFSDYGYDVNTNCHKIYSGKDKKTDKRIVVTTWQSIYQLPPLWFSKYGCIFGDEVHGFKSKSLSAIMNKSVKAEYRYGTTGTLDGSDVHKLQLEGLFGIVKKVTTTNQLQKDKQLAPLEIQILLLRYKDRQVVGKTYQEEIDCIVSNNKRNHFIRNLALSLDGNTLVLFNLVDKHGKVLRDLIDDKIDKDRMTFYVSGETKTNDREAVRSIVEKQSNSIIIASLGTFSTGINIKNIHNIIFASPSKSQIRVLQSIGRGLRLSDDGRTTRLYDLVDDLTEWNSKKPNYTLKHGGERVNIYNKEQFKHKATQVKL